MDDAKQQKKKKLNLGKWVVQKVQAFPSEKSECILMGSTRGVNLAALAVVSYDGCQLRRSSENGHVRWRWGELGIGL